MCFTRQVLQPFASLNYDTIVAGSRCSHIIAQDSLVYSYVRVCNYMICTRRTSEHRRVLLDFPQGAGAPLRNLYVQKTLLRGTILNRTYCTQNRVSCGLFSSPRQYAPATLSIFIAFTIPVLGMCPPLHKSVKLS